ncbi:MAG: hypothetical protein AAGA30_10685 [Planctomycetota bacterium]
MNIEKPERDKMQSDIALQIEQTLSNDKMIVRSFSMIISTSVIFGFLGALIGLLLAILTPAYFREIYEAVDSDIWQITLTLGLTRGLICGVIAASSVLVATSWYRSRIKNALISHYQDEQIEQA